MDMFEPAGLFYQSLLAVGGCERPCDVSPTPRDKIAAPIVKASMNNA